MIKRKVYRKLFPFEPCPLPDAPASFQDVVITRTKIFVSFADRLRILFTGKAEVETRTVTENIVGGTRTASVLRAGQHT